MILPTASTYLNPALDDELKTADLEFLVRLGENTATLGRTHTIFS